MGRILFMTQVLPYPLNTGARVRQYYVLRYLNQAHAVTLVSFVREDDRPEHIAHLKTICTDVYTVPMTRSKWRDIRAVIKGSLRAAPFIVVRDEIEAMRATITRLLASRSFDVMHADQVSMAQYGLMGHGLRRVLDLHNALYLVTQRLADHRRDPISRQLLRREAKALAAYEASLCRRFDQVVFVTAKDRQAVESQIARINLSVPDGRFSTIPICIDPAVKQLVKPAAQPHRVTILGVMFWPPNAEGAKWFAHEVWPRVRHRFPGVCLTVVGRNPPDELSELNGTGANIEVTGYVTDLGKILAETAVFVVPLRAGGGMRVKILDAWCWGLPVVSTGIGAEGALIRDGENILIADSAEAFGDAVMQVLGEPSLREHLIQNGRRWVEENYDWRRVYTAWDTVYGRLLSR